MTTWKEHVAHYWRQFDWANNTDAAIGRLAGVSWAVAHYWRVKFGAARSGGRTMQGIWNHKHSVEVSIPKWRTWDWTKRDIELAREHGLCRERIRQIRKLLKIPRTAKSLLIPRMQALDFTRFSIPELEQQSGIAEGTLRAYAKRCGITLKPADHQKQAALLRHPTLALMNWALPNVDLESIWHRPFNVVATARMRDKHPATRWRRQRGSIPTDPLYHQAIAAETAKAAAYFKEKTNEPIARV